MPAIFDRVATQRERAARQEGYEKGLADAQRRAIFQALFMRMILWYQDLEFVTVTIYIIYENLTYWLVSRRK